MLRHLVLGAVATLAAAWQPAVKTGLDTLVDSNFASLAGKKVIILTNPTGLTQGLDPNVDAMVKSGAVNLVGIIGPEHGFRGAAEAGEGAGGTFIDNSTGLTVYDGYNAKYQNLTQFITASGADTVVFDIQDVGARFYTYTSAMYDTLVASTLCGTEFVVLDRPNPLTGLNAYGPILNISYASYVGRAPMAQSHGMTTGELATMFVGEGYTTETAKVWANLTRSGADITKPRLSVVKMEGWTRGMSWRDTGLKFIIPSPNLPTTTTASVYPGLCLFEGTSMSEGRGTTVPFENIGAGFGNTSWNQELRSLGLPHSWYRDACFTPTFSKWNGTTVCGVQVYLDFVQGPDYSSETYGTFDPVYLGVAMVKTAYDLYHVPGNDTTGFYFLPNPSTPDRPDIDILAGGPLIREGILQGWSVDQIRDAWTPALEDWKANVRAKYLLYV